jgi:tight adherence protein B
VSTWWAAVSLALAVMLGGRRRPVARLADWSDPDHEATAGTAGLVVGGWLLALAAGGLLVALRVPIPLVVGAGLVAAVGQRLRTRWRSARARDECRAATVEVTFALAGELQAGRTSDQALAAVAAVGGPLQSVLAAAVSAVSLGSDAPAELARAAETPGAERLRYVAAAWAVASSTGGRVAVVLERLSQSMDDDDELRRELDAAMAGPRATMVMLGGLPLLGLGLGQAVGAHPVSMLLHRPLGWGLLTAAALLDGLGVAVTAAIARAALRP